jgi:IclR family KDG regulon transcriptional repressor
MNSPSVVRAVEILRELAGAPRGLTLTELARGLRLAKSSVHGIVYSLAGLGCVRREPETGRFSLGVGIFELGAAYLRRLDLVQEFNDVAAAVVARTGETVQLAVLDGRDVVYISKRDGTQPVRLVSEIGRRLPAHATALGRALLATHPDWALRELYRGVTLQRLTPYTVGSLPALLADLKATRTRGYAHDREQTALGIECFAAPIRNHTGEPVAALSVSAMTSRLTARHTATIIAQVQWAAAESSRRLGARVAAATESPGRTGTRGPSTPDHAGSGVPGQARALGRARR